METNKTDEAMVPATPETVPPRGQAPECQEMDESFTPVSVENSPPEGRVVEAWISGNEVVRVVKRDGNWQGLDGKHLQVMGWRKIPAGGGEGEGEGEAKQSGPTPHDTLGARPHGAEVMEDGRGIGAKTETAQNQSQSRTRENEREPYLGGKHPVEAKDNKAEVYDDSDEDENDWVLDDKDDKSKSKSRSKKK